MGRDLTRENLGKALSHIAADTAEIEVMTHPGYQSEADIGGLPVPDEFSLSKDRYFELSQLQTFENNADFSLNFK
jgi:hypothetical protein